MNYTGPVVTITLGEYEQLVADSKALQETKSKAACLIIHENRSMFNHGDQVFTLTDEAEAAVRTLVETAIAKAEKHHKEHNDPNRRNTWYENQDGRKSKTFSEAITDFIHWWKK